MKICDFGVGQKVAVALLDDPSTGSGHAFLNRPEWACMLRVSKHFCSWHSLLFNTPPFEREIGREKAYMDQLSLFPLVLK